MTCATGALLFVPAASVRVYGFFLFALFVMACGQGVLEVAANPYVTVLGPPESSERRLNFARSFNSVGAVITPIIGAAFILTGVEYSGAQLAAMTPAQRQAYEVAEAATVRVPYMVIASLFLLEAVLIYLAHLPEVREEGDLEKNPGQPLGWLDCCDTSICGEAYSLNFAMSARRLVSPVSSSDLPSTLCRAFRKSTRRIFSNFTCSDS